MVSKNIKMYVFFLLVVCVNFIIYSAESQGSINSIGDSDLLDVSILLLSDRQDCISATYELWYDVLGKKTYDKEKVRKPFENLLKSYRSDDLPLAKIALLNEEVIGFCALNNACTPRKGACPWSDERPEKKPWLALFIAARHQKKGLGTLLIKNIGQEAQKLGFGMVYLVSSEPDLEKLYIKKGCEEIDKALLDGKEVSILSLSLDTITNF